MAWTTTDLLAAVRRSGYLPDASDLSDADLLAFGDEELVDRFADVMKTSREEYRVTREDVALVVGTTRYRTNDAAMAGTARGVTYVDAAGLETPMYEASAMEAWRFGGDRHYYFEGDDIILVSAPTTSGTTMRVRYVAAFPRLVPVTSAAAIKTTNGTSYVDVFSVPTLAALTTGSYIDIYRGAGAFEPLTQNNFVSLYFDLRFTLTTTLPGSAEFSVHGSTAIPGRRVDYVTIAGTTVYPPIPQELHGRLAQAIEVRALFALGDPRAPMRSSMLEKSMERAVAVLEPRNQDRKPAIINHGSRLRGGRRRARYGYSG